MNAEGALRKMIEIFQERNTVYQDNWKMVGRILAELHPNGITLQTAEDHAMYSLWEQLIGKLTRFAISDMTHEDSIEDLGVYAAIILGIIKSRKESDGEPKLKVEQSASYKQLLETLTMCQNECTRLMLENRDLVASVK
jgi:hypothetical protein